MTQPTIEEVLERRLMRLLQTELPAAEAKVLERRVREEPAVAAVYDRLRESWQGLELAAVAPAPPELRRQTLERLRRVGSLASWGPAPLWGRAAAAAALLAGIAVGSSAVVAAAPPEGWVLDDGPAASVADRYWRTLSGESDQAPEAIFSEDPLFDPVTGEDPWP